MRIFIGLAALCGAAASHAGNDTILHQGRALGSDGSPINMTSDVVFTVYQGGTSKWTETDTDVSFEDGYYAAVLGDNVASSLVALDWANGTYELGVQLVGSPELSPRTPLHGVARAIRGPVNVSGADRPCTLAEEGTLRYDNARLLVCYNDAWQIAWTGCTAGSQVLSYTSADQSFVVPDGCGTLSVTLWGAGGGGGYNDTHGAAGGFAEGELDVTGGETLTVVVGQGGRMNAASGVAGPSAYGFGGAAKGGNACATGGGGGLTGVFRGAVNAAGALIIAGGGGGASGHVFPGVGGDPTNGGGASGLAGVEGDSAWEGGGGGGLTGGTISSRKLKTGFDPQYMAGEGGESTLQGAREGGTLAFGNDSQSTTVRTPPQTAHTDYPGVGTSGNAAIAYGGRGQTSSAGGTYCNDAGHGAAILRWSP